SYSKNRIYRNLRDLAVEFGHSFTSEDYCDYYVLRFKALPTIIATKKIPYAAFYPALKRLEGERPGLFDIEQVPLIPDYYLLHETAHCVMNHILTVHCSAQQDAGVRRSIVLPTTMGEAAATTGEAMSNLGITNSFDTYVQMHNSAFHFPANDEEARKALP